MKMDKKYMVWIAAGVLALALIGTGVGILLHRQQKQIKRLEIDNQRMETDNQRMVIEYEQNLKDQQLNELEQQGKELLDQYNQFEEQRISINDPSLLEQLDAEKLKVQKLLEELQKTEKTSAARIQQLTTQLKELQGVAKGYLERISELQQENAKLTQQNAAITKQYEEVTQTADQLTTENAELTEKVTLAAKLDAVNVQTILLNKRDKPLKKNKNKIKDVKKIKIEFSIAKNVTAEVGLKDIYVRIVKPDGDVLVKDRANVFPFEGQEMNYSCRTQIEYDGSEINNIALYWDVEEYLLPGDYRVEIFADNYIIGRSSFSLKE